MENNKEALSEEVLHITKTQLNELLDISYQRFENHLKQCMPMIFGDEKSLPGIKIFKSANKMSTLHIESALKYWKENNKGEHVYKGNMIFSITEHPEGKKRKYLQAFLSKDKAKSIMKAIINGNFSTLYPNGYKSYGKRNDKEMAHSLRARYFQINESNGDYTFKIDDSPGKEEGKGNVKSVGPVENTVYRKVPKDEIIRMAHEVYDFIRDQELIAQLKGEPLQTKMAQKKTLEENDFYKVQMGDYKGRAMNDLDIKELKAIAVSTKENKTEDGKVLFNETMKELQRRVNTAS